MKQGFAYCLIEAGFFPGSLLKPEDVNDICLRNFG
jgi:hypothetical protein